jgi:hypothetical protein
LSVSATLGAGGIIQCAFTLAHHAPIKDLRFPAHGRTKGRGKAAGNAAFKAKSKE